MKMLAPPSPVLNKGSTESGTELILLFITTQIKIHSVINLLIAVFNNYSLTKCGPGFTLEAHMALNGFQSSAIYTHPWKKRPKTAPCSCCN